MIALKETTIGIELPVRAQPGARCNAVRGEQAGALKVAVTQVAGKGKANRAVIEVLCQALDLRKSQVELVQGSTAQQKRFLIRGISRHELEIRLATALATT